MNPRTPPLVVLALALVSLALACSSGTGTATRETCPITIPPQPGFVPPPDWMPDPSPRNGSVWYGDANLWTILDPEGEVWTVWNTGRLPLKHFWFSTTFSATKEPWPDIGVTLTLLGRDEVIEVPGRATHGMRSRGELHEFMITSGDLTPGCWEITATYREATLSFIALVIKDGPQPPSTPPPTPQTRVPSAP